MKIINTLILISLIALKSIDAQTFQVDTLRYNGDVNTHINIVVMGDGYTSAQQSNFIGAANNLTDYLLSEKPWKNYANYFNVFAIRVISTESGAKHPGTATDCSGASVSVPISNPATYFGCSFDVYNIHRLVVPQNTSNIASVLSANFPNYDQVFIISNSPYYGGSGGTFATSTIESNSKEISAHEIGHSFAGLADEYYAGDFYSAEKPNMTQQTNTSTVKWKNWIGSNGIGIYQHCCGGSSSLWYRPHNTCKMRALNYEFCEVCSQAIIETIHSLTNPIISYSPMNTVVNSANQFINFKITELLRPVPNSLSITWQLDGNNIASTDSFQLDQSILGIGSYSLVASVTDTTHMLRVDDHAAVHVSTVTWTINKTTSALELTNDNNEITYSFYPNPANNYLNISVNLKKKSNVEIELLTVNGELVEKLVNKTLDAGSNMNSINIEKFAKGAYFVAFKIDGYSRNEKLIIN